MTAMQHPEMERQPEMERHPEVETPRGDTFSGDTLELTYSGDDYGSLLCPSLLGLVRSA